ncbi:MAG: deoxynucleoside kinase, partial [Flavobacteriales bacterium]
MKNNFIVIEGNIGSGKTTLSKMIAEKYEAKLVLEEFDE